MDSKPYTTASVYSQARLTSFGTAIMGGTHWTTNGWLAEADALPEEKQAKLRKYCEDNFLPSADKALVSIFRLFSQGRTTRFKFLPYPDITSNISKTEDGRTILRRFVINTGYQPELSDVFSVDDKAYRYIINKYDIGHIVISFPKTPNATPHVVFLTKMGSIKAFLAIYDPEKDKKIKESQRKDKENRGKNQVGH